jgi:hypothetical protein
LKHQATPVFIKFHVDLGFGMPNPVDYPATIVTQVKVFIAKSKLSFSLKGVQDSGAFYLCSCLYQGVFSGFPRTIVPIFKEFSLGCTQPLL